MSLIGQMRTIIFSDTHLTNRFDKHRSDFMRRIINRTDRVIINGDFWDDSVKNHRFMVSQWKQLFPMLKKKKTIYVYGNHDKKEKWSEDVHQFCVRGCSEYRFRSGKREFIVKHGDSLVPAASYRHLQDKHKNPVARLFWWSALIIPHRMHGLMIALRLERLPIFFTEGRFYENFKYLNEHMKEHTRQLGKDQFLICGHSHSQEIDMEKNYINTGFINHGIGQYAVIEDGKISMVDDRY